MAEETPSGLNDALSVRNLQLRIEQGLSAPEIVKGHEGVVLLEVADPRGVELPRQPVAAVENDLDLEWQPGLQPHVQRAEDGVIQIEVIVQALADGGAQLQVLGLRVVMQLVGPAGLDATEDGDQAGWLSRTGQGVREVLFTLRARG